MMQPLPKSYLGDGAYIECNGYEVILTTEDGIRTTNTVVLGDGELSALIAYLRTVGVKWA